MNKMYQPKKLINVLYTVFNDLKRAIKLLDISSMSLCPLQNSTCHIYLLVFRLATMFD